MALIESELGAVLSAPVRHRRNRTRNLRQTANRIVSKCPEVMVKITSFGKGVGAVKAHLTYISRNGKVMLENDRGEFFSGKEQVSAFFQDWQGDIGDRKRHKNQRDTMHLILSMPETTDSESVRNATRAFVSATFGQNYEYVFALHTDEPHPHCHVTVKCLGFDGTRLNPRKADLQDWRESFAEKLRDQGVDAEATSRRARGVVRKPESSVVRHIERGDKSHPPRVSKVRAMKFKEAAEELSAQANGVEILEKPWDAAIKVRQQNVRHAWLATANLLDQTQDIDSSLAERIRAFVGAMPSVETEFHQIKKELVQRFSKQSEKTHENDLKKSVSHHDVHAEKLKRQGRGYQSRLNAILRDAMIKDLGQSR